MSDLPEIITSLHGIVVVVRDDLLPGGTKVRVAESLFDGVDEVVYASPVYGYAQIALAHTAARLGKRATIFCAKRASQHPRTQEAIRAGAKVVEVPCGYLTVVSARAKEYCSTSGAKLIPFGFDTPQIVRALADVALSVRLPTLPDEVWCVAGSGVLSRSLQVAWPKAKHFAVQVGHVPNIQYATLHVAKEKFEQDARIRPPFPSCSNYDAKVWTFIKQHATPGALFWNVAA